MILDPGFRLEPPEPPAAMPRASTRWTPCWRWYVLLVFIGPVSVVRSQPVPDIVYDTPRVAGRLADPAITESSGLAAGRRNPGVLWTCNDSGDRSRIFALDTTGKSLASYEIKGKNVDWEDLASFEARGKCWLLIADVGNNSKDRDTLQLYLVEEPDISANAPTSKKPLKPSCVMSFSYEGGPKDCEAVAVDAISEKILLVTKVWGLSCDVYELPLPRGTETKHHVAKRLATLTLLPATAMDISPDGRRAIVSTYGDAFEYSRSPGESWAVAFGRSARRLPMPRRKQGEALCFGRDGTTVYLTSEGKHSPLHVVPRKLEDR